MDEAYYGGKGNAGENNKNYSQMIRQKSILIGAIERDGDMKAEKSPDTKAKTLGKFLNKNIAKKNTRLLTDQSNRYKKVAEKYDRHSVNHKRKEYVRDDIHVNNIESFWGHFKKSINGTHKSISKKYLQAYLDGFVWHRNNRHNDRKRFASLLGALLSV